MIHDITFELAKKVGFNLSICNCGGFPDCICNDEKPTQTVLQKWLREVKFIDVLVGNTYPHSKTNLINYATDITTSRNDANSKYCKNYVFGITFTKYEDALEHGLLNALEILRTSVETP